MINVDGTGFTQLTDSDESGEFDPDWKPYTRSDTNAGMNYQADGK
jgi:hypothetical protein